MSAAGRSKGMDGTLCEDRILVLGPSDVLKARRRARELASWAGLDEAEQAYLETAVSELATNLLKHRAVSGEMTLVLAEEEGRAGVEIVSRDHGPGIRDLASALAGGASTAGTLGIGLSGVRRIMDSFEIRSEPGTGTVVRARKFAQGRAPLPMRFSVAERPKPGERVSGDAHFLRQAPTWALFCVLDVLGHGEEAHETAVHGLSILEHSYRYPLPEVVAACHRGLLRTRGAAMALCRADFDRGSLEHLCVGNVETRIFGTRDSQRPFCVNGTVGVVLPSRLQVSTYPLEAGMVVAMFSDGISGRFESSQVMSDGGPREIASRIFSGWARDTDDATVLVGKVAGHG